LRSFEERRREKQRRHESDAAKSGSSMCITFAELAALPRRVTSEQRLERLPPESRNVELFRDTLPELQQAANLKTRLVSTPDQLPDLGSDTTHKYGDCYVNCRERLTAGENLLISVIIEGSRVIGFAIAALTGDGSATIEIVDVDRYSGRSSGLETELELQNERFTVGVAHVLIDLIASEIHGALLVDATTPSSRYIFKSLGFVPQPGDTNPCHLRRTFVEG
jgi:hypothetical protein